MSSSSTVIDLFGLPVSVPADLGPLPIGLRILESGPAPVAVVEFAETLNGQEWDLDENVWLQIVVPGRIQIVPRRVLGQATRVHYAVDLAAPLALASLGEVIIHGAALTKNEQAVLIMGASGQGKSTLCTMLCASGYSILADDSTRVSIEAGAITVWPSYPTARLNPDVLQHFPNLRQVGLVAEYGKKVRVDMTPHFEPEPRPLHQLVVLGARTKVASLTRLGSAELLSSAVQNCFRSPTRSDEVGMLFDSLSFVLDLAGARLDYERSAHGTQEAIRLLDGLVSKPPPRSGS